MPAPSSQSALNAQQAAVNAYATLMPLAITAGPMHTQPTGYDASGMAYGQQQQGYGGYPQAPGYGQGY